MAEGAKDSVTTTGAKVPPPRVVQETEYSRNPKLTEKEREPIAKELMGGLVEAFEQMPEYQTAYKELLQKSLDDVRKQEGATPGAVGIKYSEMTMDQFMKTYRGEELTQGHTLTFKKDDATYIVKRKAHSFYVDPSEHKKTLDTYQKTYEMYLEVQPDGAKLPDRDWSKDDLIDNSNYLDKPIKTRISIDRYSNISIISPNNYQEYRQWVHPWSQRAGGRMNMEDILYLPQSNTVAAVDGIKAFQNGLMNSPKTS